MLFKMKKGFWWILYTLFLYGFAIFGITYFVITIIPDNDITKPQNLEEYIKEYNIMQDKVRETLKPWSYIHDFNDMTYVVTDFVYMELERTKEETDK